VLLDDGIVGFLGYDRHTGLEVTWYEVIFRPTTPKAEIDRIFSTASRFRDLKHPSLSALLHFWSVPNTPKLYFITESISTSSIFTNLNSDFSLTRPKAISRWFIPVLTVLDYLHSMRPPIVHRKVQLSSIFVKASNGSVKLDSPSIIPFPLSSGSSFTKIQSTMPPEFLWNECGTYSDIWSFGLAILYVFTRELPYSECKTPEMLVAKLRNYEPPDSLETVKETLAHDLIRSCLSRPLLRPTARELLSHPYFAQGGDEKVEEQNRQDGYVVLFSKKTSNSVQTLPAPQRLGRTQSAPTKEMSEAIERYPPPK
jgi:WNK lysine deficient protein kinase